MHDAIRSFAGLAAVVQAYGKAAGREDLFSTDSSGYNSLHLAVRTRQLDVATFLLSANPGLRDSVVEYPADAEGAEVFGATHVGMSPASLLIATWDTGRDVHHDKNASKEWHRVSVHILRVLMSFGASMTLASRTNGGPPLHIAIDKMSNTLECRHVLGELLNVPSAKLPLLDRCFTEHQGSPISSRAPEMVERKLAEAVAQLYHQTPDGDSASDLASRRDNDAWKAWFRARHRQQEFAQAGTS